MTSPELQRLTITIQRNEKRKMKMKTLPNRLWVYVADYDDDKEPILCVSKNLEDIPHDAEGDLVGEYRLVWSKKLFVKHEFK